MRPPLWLQGAALGVTTMLAFVSAALMVMCIVFYQPVGIFWYGIATIVSGVMTGLLMGE